MHYSYAIRAAWHLKSPATWLCSAGCSVFEDSKYQRSVGRGLSEHNPMSAVCFSSQWASTWWRHQMETFSVLMGICAGNSPLPGEFPSQRPVTRTFDVYFYLRLNKRLRKQSWGWWFETLSCSLWRHCNDVREASWTVVIACYSMGRDDSRVLNYAQCTVPDLWSVAIWSQVLCQHPISEIPPKCDWVGSIFRFLMYLEQRKQICLNIASLSHVYKT